MTAARTRGVLLVSLAAILAAGCAEAPAPSKPEERAAPASERAEPLLVVRGERVDGDGTTRREPRRNARAVPATATPVRTALAGLLDEEPWPAPELRADGSIDEGDDPFEGAMLETQPAPIEDDPEATRELAALSFYVRRTTLEAWQQWRAAGIQPWEQEQDDTMQSLVRIAVERCGGARTVSAGVVLAPETVVTTVHAIESPARRVWVTPALGDPERVPAIVRYIDVDDDIAVLKVPGLDARPLGYSTANRAEQAFGFAYGIARGAGSGTVRRAPVHVGLEEVSMTIEQPDGFAERITDRSVLPVLGAIDTGFSGGIVTLTTDRTRRAGWAFHGLIRARVPYRADGGGVVVPARLVREAVAASEGLEPWFEHRPAGGCPQWRR